MGDEMPTMIAFSGQRGDWVLVEEDLEDVRRGLSRGSADDLRRFTQIPEQMQNFEPGPVLINPDRVAYVKAPAGS
ncbi:MAG: hypothetical protein ACTHNP_05205 [Solirubrobacterales bacterium]